MRHVPAALVAAAAIALAQPAWAVAAMQFDFEGGLDGWSITGSGASSDCTYGRPGCSLRVDPRSPGAWLLVERDVDVPLLAGTPVSFWFLGGAQEADTDTNFEVHLDDGGLAYLVLTDGFNPNTRVSLVSQDLGQDRRFGNWFFSKTWFRMVMWLDPDDDTVRAEVRDSSDSLRYSSGRIPIPESSDRITRVRTSTVYWGGHDGPTFFDYDAIRIGGEGVPTPPRDPTAAPGVRSVVVGWKAPSDTGGGTIDRYRVHRQDASGAFVPVGTAGPGARTYTDDGLLDNTTFTYVVTAENVVGESDASNVTTASTPGVPWPPRDLRSSSLRPFEVQLRWVWPLSDGGAPLTGYHVYGHDGSGAWRRLATVPADQTSYVDTLTLPLKTYWYRVVARNGVGDGNPSNVDCATGGPYLTGPESLQRYGLLVDCFDAL